MASRCTPTSVPGEVCFLETLASPHKPIISKMISGFFCLLLAFSTPSYASDFKYRRNVSIKIGQKVVIYGVRNRDCGAKAPAWDDIADELPKSTLGEFSDGGAGTTDSKICEGRGPSPRHPIPSREVRQGNADAIR